jgi:hypothetical protein
LVDLRRSASPRLVETDRLKPFVGFSFFSILDLIFCLILAPTPSPSSLLESLLSLLSSPSLESGVCGSPSQTSISTERQPCRRTYQMLIIVQTCTLEATSQAQAHRRICTRRSITIQLIPRQVRIVTGRDKIIRNRSSKIRLRRLGLGRRSFPLHVRPKGIQRNEMICNWLAIWLRVMLNLELCFVGGERLVDLL